MNNEECEELEETEETNECNFIKMTSNKILIGK